MHEAATWIATSQSVAPILTGVFMIVMMKWLSRHWSAATAARTVRVTSRLRSSRGSRDLGR
jgi:hypothetical protein